MAQPALLGRMQAQWKLSRAWGLANLMIVHRLSDLDAIGDAGSEARGLAQGLLRDTATRILYNEPYDEAQAAAKALGQYGAQARPAVPMLCTALQDPNKRVSESARKSAFEHRPRGSERRVTKSL